MHAFKGRTVDNAIAAIKVNHPNLGAAIGEHFIQSAREEATRLDRRRPDRDLGWLDEGTGLFDRYWEALTVAQDYAQERRQRLHVSMPSLTRTPTVYTVPAGSATSRARRGSWTWRAVSGCVKARINGEQWSPLPAVCGAGDDSERWVGV